MKTKNGSMRALREAMAILDDTRITVVEGGQGPLYSGAQGEEATMRVGLRWIEKHYPEAFEEVLRYRLQKPTGE